MPKISKMLPLVVLLLMACTRSVYSQNELKKILDFDGVIEQKTPIPKGTESLYNYAHYHDLHSLWTKIMNLMILYLI